ncbi:class I adenylate-forming enzyme family protein [Paenibacillus sp. GCM10027627]|uniref:class I adenylate-forming enzyme family protein n=1 Tax=unclassified Paenibacillus TaxID=185978 RepID=UPI003625B9B9
MSHAYTTGLSSRRLEDWFHIMGQSQAEVVDASVYPPLHVTYKELIEAVQATTEEWEHKGIQTGHIVVLAMPSNLTLLIHILALMRLKAAPAPISNLFGTETLSHICKTIHPAAILTSSGKLDEVLPSSFLASEQPFSFYTPNTKLYINQDVTPDTSMEGCLILSTTGSTGLPKSVVHLAENVIINAYLHTKSIEESRGGTYISTLPIFYSYGLIAGLFGALTLGKTIYFPEQPFSPHNWLDFCEQNNIALASITPSLLHRLVALDKPFPSGLKKLTVGGDSSNLNDLYKLRERFEGEIYLTYGLSEAGPRVMTNKLGPDDRLWPYMGMPLDGVEVTLANSERVNGEEVGELLIYTPTAMLGYLDNHMFCRDDFVGDWLKTGDICARAIAFPEQLRFVERKKNIIICGGEKLYPGIIRNVLLQHPLVEEAKIIALDDARWGSVPSAIVKLSEAGTSSDLPGIMEWCKKYLRKVEVPRSIEADPNLKVVMK